jgi:NAD-dependent SIR2 family protein deacetylase
VDDMKDYFNQIRNGVIPHCHNCSKRGNVLKPDITFYGEEIDPHVHELLEEDKHRVDLVLVIGSSLKVAPIKDIIHYYSHVPQMLINKCIVRPSSHFNLIFLGDCDTICVYLYYRLRQTLQFCIPHPVLESQCSTQIPHSLPVDINTFNKKQNENALKNASENGWLESTVR